MGSRKQKPNQNWKRKREKTNEHTGEHSVDEIISNFMYRLWSREQTAHIGR